LNWNGTSVRRPVGSFTGELDVEADLDGEVTAIFRYKIKRTGIFGVCVPYWVKYHSFQLKGSVSLDGSLGLSGSLSNSNNPWEWSKEIAKPHLGTTDFSIGPIFVRLGYKLPIRAGLKAGITVQADVDYETSGVSTGTFDYTCIGVTRCTGHASLNAQGFTNPQAVTGSIQGRAELEAYVDIGFRAYLYRESLAYAQVGVRPKAIIDLWGYYGNNCGDADCDESAEVLAALTASIDWKIAVTGELKGLGRSTKAELLESPAFHLAFFDFLDSPALEPMLHGPGTVRLNEWVTYQARMRPCWPYDDDVTYEVEWEDGTVNTFTKAPDEYQNLSHYFPNAGSKPVTVTAVRDAHGRRLNRSTTRDIEVSVFAGTDDPNCSAGGTGSGGGSGGTGGSGLTAQLNCLARATGGSPGWEMQCSGSGRNGLAPFTYQWKYGNGPWMSGGSTRTFQCQALEDPIRFRVRDANGQWSSSQMARCPGGIG
ncbi:MAG: hypothetical protein AAGF23_17575, partial [Acidobacteriota bacterium]